MFIQSAELPVRVDFVWFKFCNDSKIGKRELHIIIAKRFKWFKKLMIIGFSVYKAIEKGGEK
jgi:hypothetical protein